MAYKCDTLVHVDNLPPYIREEEVEKLFFNLGQVTLGKLRDCKTMTYAFVQFEDSRTAEDAVIARDGYEYQGFRLKVELVRSKGPNEFQTRSSSGRGPHKYTVLVSGLPPTASWQGLKDHMKTVGYVCYASVYNDGTGIVDFLRHEDMKYAVKKLDGSRFVSLQGEISLIRVRADHSASVGNDLYRSTSDSDHYRVLVTGLPPTGSWQDLKYHMSEAGHVDFAWVFHDGTGIVDFLSDEAMSYALRKLDGSRFISKKGETSHIRVREDPSGSGGYHSPAQDRSESHQLQSRSSSLRYIKEEHSEVNDHLTKDRSESYGHELSRSRSRSKGYAKKELSKDRYDRSTRSRDRSLGKRGVPSRSRSPRYVEEEHSYGEGSDSPRRNRNESYRHGRPRSRSRSSRYVKEVSRYDRLAKERSESPEKGGPRNRRGSKYYGVSVTGLPPTSSWQDLKNHMSVAGYVRYASVYKDGTGTVEFFRHEDMKYAVKKMNGSRFRSSKGETSDIRVTEDHPKDGGRDIKVVIEWEPKAMEKGNFEV